MKESKHVSKLKIKMNKISIVSSSLRTQVDFIKLIEVDK